MWRPTVGELMKRVDAILIDVTEVTDGLCWELSAVQDLGRFDDCIYLSSDDSQHRSAPVVANQLGRLVVLNGFDGTGRLEPVQFRQNLSSILFRRAHPDDRAPLPTPFPAP